VDDPRPLHRRAGQLTGTLIQSIPRAVRPADAVPGVGRARCYQPTDADLLAAYSGRAVPEPERAWQLPEVSPESDAGPPDR